MIASLPADASVLGYSADDFPETSLWKPFGSRRILHMKLTDSAEEVRQRGLKYLLVTVDRTKEPWPQWLQRMDARELQTVTLKMWGSLPPFVWHLVELNPAHATPRQPETRTSTGSMTREPTGERAVTEAAGSAPAPIELTIVMPCLNEAETLAACIRKGARWAWSGRACAGKCWSPTTAAPTGRWPSPRRLGARVVQVKEKGYGSALRGGIEAARGKWIIMGDADDSYDFSQNRRFRGEVPRGLRPGHGLPAARAAAGRLRPGRCRGRTAGSAIRVLSFIGRLFFKCPARDFHCGLRGFTREAYREDGTEDHRDGIRLRDGDQGHVEIVAHRRGADHAASGRAFAAAASEAVAGRLAAPAVHADLLAALAVPGAGPGAGGAGRWRPAPRWP